MYEMQFVAGQINGPKLKSLNHKKLQNLGIEDTGHRAMISACIEALSGELKTVRLSSVTQQSPCFHFNTRPSIPQTDKSFTQRCQLSKSEPLDPVQIMDTVPVSGWLSDLWQYHHHHHVTSLHPIPPPLRSPTKENDWM